MAAKTIKRSSGDTSSNSNTKSSNGIRIHPVFIGIAFALLINFLRARLKDAGIISSPTGASSSMADYARFDQQQQQQQQQQFNLAAERSSVQSTLAQARAGGGTQVKSNFIQDEALLATLNDHHVWEECTRLSQFGTGSVLWLDHGAPPTNMWETLAVQIWMDHPLLKKADNNAGHKIAGYEYWCNILTPHTPLDWHVDKDEIVFEQQAGDDPLLLLNLKTPTMGAVWYGYPHTFRGGALETFPYSPHQVPDPTLVADLDQHVERYAAHYNRLVFLNVSEWHRVTPLTSGSRYTLAVNVWKEKPRLTAAEEQE